MTGQQPDNPLPHGALRQQSAHACGNRPVHRDLSIHIVGIGEAGNRLLGALRGTTLPGVVDDYRMQQSAAVFAPENVTPGTFCGADFALVLASASERQALHMTCAAARAARQAGAHVIGMLTQDTADHFDGHALLAGTEKSLDSLIALPPAPDASLVVALLAAYVSAAPCAASRRPRMTVPAGAELLDLRTAFARTGEAHLGAGRADGSDRTHRAVDAAMDHVGRSWLERAAGVLILVAGSRSLRLREIAAVVDMVDGPLAEHCNVSLAVHYDKRLDDALRVTLIAAARRD